MIELSKQAENFLRQYVYKHMGIQEVTEENIEEIVEFISKQYEDPLSLAASRSEHIDEYLLKSASQTITELTKNW